MIGGVHISDPMIGGVHISELGSLKTANKIRQTNQWTNSSDGGIGPIHIYMYVYIYIYVCVYECKIM